MRAGEVSYYLYDGHGDVRALLNEAGRITDKYRYNAYGELLEKTGDTENHYLYTGEYYDGTSNLYYLRARYMNPSTGTFISMDTYEGSIYDPDTLHKYLYANGNPVTYSDPSGNFASAVGGLVATTINTVMNNFQTLNAMGIISGLTNSAITAFLGGSDMEIGEAFFKGYVTGFGLGAVLYVAAAYSVVVYAQLLCIMSAANLSISIVMMIASVMRGNDKATLVYGTLAVLSIFTFAQAYKLNCTVNVIGDKGCAKIGFDNSNPDNPILDGNGIGSEKVNPYELTPTHAQTKSNRQMNKLISGIREEGIIEPIKYVEYNGVKYVVDGHHRLIAAKRLKLTIVPVEKVELPFGGYKTLNDLFWYDEY